MCGPCAAAGDGAGLLWSSDEIGSGTAGTPEPGGGAGLQDIGIGGARLLRGGRGEGAPSVRVLGQNFGRVTRITETEVVLREIVQDAAGEWIERPAALQLVEGNIK